MGFAKAPRRKQTTYSLGILGLEQVNICRSLSSLARSDMLAVFDLGDDIEGWPGTIARTDFPMRRSIQL